MFDFVLNGQGVGSVASRLQAYGFNELALRPWVGNDGRHYVDALDPRTGLYIPQPVHNAVATLRKDAWIRLDEAVIAAAKERLRFVADLRAAGLTYTVPNGLGKTVLQWERQSDITEATISMDGMRRGNSDRPIYDLQNLPLPIIHKDFSFSIRNLEESRNSNSPLDTTTAGLAGRRVAESIEQLALGVSSAYTFGGAAVYGATNFPQRNTKVLTSPATAGWTPAVTVSEVLAMKSQSQADKQYGPWMLYCSPNWDEYMDDDYSAAKGDNTLRERLAKIDNINGCQTLDYLTGYTLLLVQRAQETARMVIGMDIVTVQWDTQGGMEQNFKVMAIIVPQVRADINNNCGIVHGASA